MQDWWGARHDFLQDPGLGIVSISWMKDVVQRILESKSGPLAALIATTWEGSPPETSIKLAGLLTGELSRPLSEALRPWNQTEMVSALELVQGKELAVPSLADVIFEPCTPIECLRVVKDGFKRWRVQSPDPHGAAVASALYYASVAAALVNHGIRISELSSESLKQAFDWMLDQAWIDPRCRELACKALKVLACSA
jgi:hypothetical protein